MESQIWVALALSMVGSFSTAFGALLVVIQPTPKLSRLGVLQGFAGGLMLCISFMDLAHNAINAIGFSKANVWFFCGVITFAIIVNFIPEPTLDYSQPDASVKKAQEKKDDDFSASKDKDLSKKRKQRVLFSGIITAVGISLHNFPEGMAVFLGSLKGLRVGIKLAFAIALHNIPEGIAVALPVYYASESTWQAFKYAALSGFAEPLGVVLVAFFFPSSLSTETLEGLLGAVGGVMAFLTLHEMLPLAFEYAGHRKAIAAVFIGMAVMSASLQILQMSLPEEVSF